MAGFWTIVFAIGAAQGVFLCGALLLRRAKNRSATRWLVLLIGVATAMIVAGALVEALPLSFDHLLVFLNINTELALGPLVLLFIRSLVDPARVSQRRDALHFLPLVSGMLLWGLAWLILGDTDRRLAFLASGPAVPVYMVFKAGWLFIYMTAAYRALDDSRISRVQAGGRQPVRLSWLRHAVLACGAMAATIYAASFAERLGLDPPIESDPFASLGLAVMIYMASLMVLQRPWVLSLRPRPALDDRWNDEAARLTAYLETERPWIRPDLSLGDLAEALGSTDNRLSAVIREGLDTSFYALVNQYRLAEFERLAKNPKLQHRSVLELAYEAGFNSKASFYPSFRESHGMTPTAFRAAT